MKRFLSKIKSKRTGLLMLAIALIAAVVDVSCRISYKLNGSAIDYNVYKTIQVGNFPIRAALVYPPLQQTFENELLDYINRNTRLQTNDGASDLSLEGEITTYQLTPQAVTEDAHLRRYHSLAGIAQRFIHHLQ